MSSPGRSFGGRNKLIRSKERTSHILANLRATEQEAAEGAERVFERCRIVQGRNQNGQIVRFGISTRVRGRRVPTLGSYPGQEE